MSVLAGTLVLHDVENVEKFAEATMKRALGGMGGGATLNAADREDCLAYLISTTWELGERYDPAKSPNGQSFSTYAGRILPLRVSSWYRIRFNGSDRARRETVEVLSLDAPIGRADGQPGGARLGDTLAASTGDPAADRSPDLARVLEGRDRGLARLAGAEGEQAPERAEAGARGAGGGGGVKRPRPRIPGVYREPRLRPSCAACTARHLKELRRGDRPEGVTDAKLREQAAEKALMVALGEDWLCPDCTTVPGPDGKSVPLRQVLPNRQARRRVARTSR